MHMNELYILNFYAMQMYPKNYWKLPDREGGERASGEDATLIG